MNLYACTSNSFTSQFKRNNGLEFWYVIYDVNALAYHRT